MNKNRCDDILAFELFSDEVRESIDLNPTMRVNLSNKRDSSSGNRESEVSSGVLVAIQMKPSGQVFERSPGGVSKPPWESCSVFFLGKSSMGFFIVIILQKSFTGSSESMKRWASMSVEDSLLPEAIKTFHSGISSRFSLGNKDQMDSQKQVQTHDLGEAISIASSTCSGHLIVQLRSLRDSKSFPCINEMFTKRKGLLIIRLTGEGCMPSHIHGVKGVEAGNSFWTPEISGTHNVRLLEISHFFCFKERVKPGVARSLNFGTGPFSISGDNPCNGRDGGDVLDLSFLKFPLNDFGTDTSEGRSSSSMRFQLCTQGNNRFNKPIGSFSPNFLWGLTPLLKTLKSIFLVASEPFGKPSPALGKNSEDLVEPVTVAVKLYCFVSLLIFILFSHRLRSSQNVLGIV